MNKYLMLIVGSLLGSASTLLFLRLQDHAIDQSSLHVAVRNTLIDSDIDALDMIQGGDVKSAELILATAANSQIIVMDKMSRNSKENDALSANWRSRMKVHNERLGLVVPMQKKAK